MYGKHHTEETKKKISESLNGSNLSDETKMKLSESKNTSGYYRVSKQKNKKCKKGFTWIYSYYNKEGRRIQISRVNIEDLKKEVKRRGLKWVKL